MTEPAWPLVGRTAQVRAGRGSLDSGRGVLIAGDAGVGKTTIARLLADELEDAVGEASITRLAATATTGLPIEAFGALAADADTDRSSDPHVVVVDDVQLLDDDAAALLHRLTVEGRIRLVGTLRTGDRAPEPVTALWKDALVERIDLDPLGRSEVDDLIDRVLDGPVDAAARRTLWELTLGSPLMFRELMRASLESGVLRQVDGLWRSVQPPRSARLDELIGARLAALEPDAFDVAELVALGEPLGFELLRAAVPLAAIDLAERAGVIEVVTDDVRRDARLAHPMFGDVLRRSMPESRRAMLSGRLLELLETTPMRRRDDIVRATTWQLQAGGTTVTDDMVLAARRALYGDEQRLAIELATRAAKGDPTRADVAVILAQALVYSGDPKRADDELADETVAHAGLGDAERALVAMQRSVALFWGIGNAPLAERVLIEAAESLSAGPWHDEVRAELAVMASNQGRHPEAIAIAEPMLARDDLSDRTFVTAAISACCSRAVDGRCLDSLELAGRAFAASDALGPQLALTKPGIFIVSQVTAMTEAGRFADAEQLSRVARDVVIADGHLDGQAWFSMTLGRVLLATGRFAEAEQRFVEASAAFAGIHSPGPRHWSLAGAVMAAVMCGEPERARTYDAERRALPVHPATMMAPEVARADAYLALADRDRTTAVASLRRSIETFASTGATSLLGWLLHDIVRFGGSVSADEASVLTGAQGDLGPARVALFAAERTADPVALEAVAGTFAEMSVPLFAAEAALAAARHFGRNGDTRAEARCRRAAGAWRDEIDDGPILTVDLHERGEADALTRREREVADLAALGRTNREIADALFVSVRTVENHLQRVYDKLGVRGRRELGATLATS